MMQRWADYIDESAFAAVDLDKRPHATAWEAERWANRDTARSSGPRNPLVTNRTPREMSVALLESFTANICNRTRALFLQLSEQ
jgi:hypothetical protein